MFLHTASWARIARVIAAAVVAITFKTPASHAEDVAIDSDVPSVSVKYADLNLATEEGSRILYHRLVAAAERVCPRIGHVTELSRNRDARACIADSVDRAVKQIRSPQLAEVAASKMR